MHRTSPKPNPHIRKEISVAMNTTPSVQAVTINGLEYPLMHLAIA